MENNKMKKGAKWGKGKAFYTLLRTPLPSNYLLLLLDKFKIHEIQILPLLLWFFYNFWRKAPNTKSTVLLSLKDQN